MGTKSQFSDPNLKEIWIKYLRVPINRKAYSLISERGIDINSYLLISGSGN